MNNNTEAQETKILHYLESGHAITPLEALEKFQCFRLAARISKIRSLGYPIISEMVNDNGKRFARYRLSA